MDRIQSFVDDDLDLSLLAPSSDPFAPLSGEVQDCHCLFAPVHYERNYAYPLVVWLHGSGDDERQVTRVMPLLSDRNYVAVGPRGTHAASGGRGYGWAQRADEIELAEARVLSAVAAARRWFHIAPSRIFLAGYADGGTMALRLALAHPRMFAGVLSLCGGLPSTLRPFAQLHALRNLKIFLGGGRAADAYPETQMCANLRLLHSAGMSVCLRLYPCGDELRTVMLSDMDRWIMEQVAPQPVVHDESLPRPRRK